MEEIKERLFNVSVGPDKFKVKKMSKQDRDIHEARYRMNKLTMKIQTLMQKRDEAVKAFSEKQITREELNAELEVMDEDVEEIEEQLMQLVDYSDDGGKLQVTKSTLMNAEKLSKSVYVNGELKSIRYWVKQDEMIFLKLSSVIDEIQLIGVMESAFILDELMLSFKEEEGQLPIPEIYSRITKLRDSITSGELERKKSESAYGVWVTE